ncbi:MAG: hypothetical protein IPK82_29285 [Polyangiaceae bacterium]|nr:hypothetical protein [Polyangiaceae bacterium]
MPTPAGARRKRLRAVCPSQIARFRSLREGLLGGFRWSGQERATAPPGEQGAECIAVCLPVRGTFAGTTRYHSRARTNSVAAIGWAPRRVETRMGRSGGFED